MKITPNPSYDSSLSTLGSGSTVSAIGIYAGSVGVTGSIVNNGSIDLEINSHWGYYLGETGGGIVVSGNVEGSVVNNGSIDFTVTGEGLTQASWYAYGIFVDRIAVGGSVTNSSSGTINVAMTASASASNSVAGILVYSGNSGTLTNAGTITVTAHEEVPTPIDTGAGMSTASPGSILAYGIHISGTAGTLVNSGTITVANTNDNDTRPAYAYGIYTKSASASDSITITGGSINVTATAQGTTSEAGAHAYGLYVDGGVEALTFSNAGTISAHGNNDGGAGSAAGVVVKGDLSTSFVNTGTVSADWNGLLAANAYSVIVGKFSPIKIQDIQLQSVTLVDNQAGGLLKGNLSLGNGVGLQNAGTVWLPEAATGGAAAYVSGGFTNLAAGVLKVEVYGKDPDDHSQLFVDGSVSLDGTLHVNVRDSGTGPLEVGDRVEDVIVTNTIGGIGGNFSKVKDNSLLFNFASVIDGDTVDLDISQGTTVYEATKARKLRPAYGAAKALDELAFGGGGAGDMQKVIDALASLETEAEVADAAYQTLPLLTGGAPRLVRDAVVVTSGSVDDRIDGLSGDMTNVQSVSRNFWIDPIGAWTQQDELDKASGYDSSLYGIVAGVDGELTSALSIGGAFAYVNTSADSVSSIIDNSASVSSYQGILYGLYGFDGGTLLRYQIDGGVHQTEGRRHMNFGIGEAAINETAKSDYGSTSVHAGASLEHGFAFADSTAFVPRVKVDYISVWAQDYDETGAGSLSLSVDEQQYETLVFSMDARVEHQLSQAVRLEASAGIGYDVLNQRSEATASYAGAPDLSFDVEGMQTDAWMAQAGAGLSYAPTEDLRLSANYSALFRDGFIANMVGLEASWKF